MKSMHIPNPLALITMILLSLPSLTWEFDEQIQSLRSAFPTDEQAFDRFIANIKNFAQTGATLNLLTDLQKKEAIEKLQDLFERTQPIREFARTTEGKKIVSYLKGYIRGNETKRFLDKVAEFTLSQGIFSRFLPNLCLSESLTTFELRKQFCAATMSWYGLDPHLSLELLEQATTLHSHGIIDVMLKVSKQARALGAEFENEINRGYTIAILWFLSTDEESRSFVERLLIRELPQHSKEWFFHFIFESNGLETWFEAPPRK